MRLQRHLNELFKSDRDLKIKWKHMSSFRATFPAGNTEYEFSASDYDDGWHISFTANIDLKTGEPIMDIRDREGITGKGKAIEVFSGIVQAFKIFVKEYRPYRMYFYGKEPSRQKLYDRFAKHIQKMGYDFSKYKDPEWPGWGMKYDFKRKKRKKSKKLSEIKMTKKTEFHDTERGYGWWTASFKAGEWEYEVYTSQDIGDMYTVVFKLSDKSLEKLYDMGVNVRNEFKLTKFGNPIPVFRGVIQALKKWLKDVDREEIRGIVFSAETYEGGDTYKETKKRMKLYQRAAPMIEKATGMKFQGVKKTMPGVFEFKFLNPDYKE